MELLLSGIQRLLCLTYVISLTIVCITAGKRENGFFREASSLLVHRALYDIVKKKQRNKTQTTEEEE